MAEIENTENIMDTRKSIVQSIYDHLSLNSGCLVFGLINIILHTGVFIGFTYGYLSVGEDRKSIPQEVLFVIGSIWALAAIAILANTLLLIGIYKKNLLCIKIFVICYGIFIALMSFGLIKEIISGFVGTKEIIETLTGILLALITFILALRYYIKLKHKRKSQNRRLPLW